MLPRRRPRPGQRRPGGHGKFHGDPPPGPPVVLGSRPLVRLLGGPQVLGYFYIANADEPDLCEPKSTTRYLYRHDAMKSKCHTREPRFVYLALGIIQPECQSVCPSSIRLFYGCSYKRRTTVVICQVRTPWGSDLDQHPLTPSSMPYRVNGMLFVVAFATVTVAIVPA